MPFCANCGVAVEGQFCARCGAPIGGGLPPVPPPGSAAGLTDNAAAALCYVAGAVTGIVFLVLAPYNQNRLIRFHAFQSIFLTVAWILFWTLANIVFSILGVFRLFMLSPLIGLAGFILWIYLIASAYQGKKVVLPFIGPLAAQQA
jgi:uncharacterized membrane protein